MFQKPNELRELAKLYRESGEGLSGEALEWRLNLADYLENLAASLERSGTPT